MLRKTLSVRSNFSLQAIKQAAVFYWNGTKELGRNFANAKRLLHLRATGHKLTWEDTKHLATCKSDMLRFVPFSVFIIVPFLEFLLPFALYFFPSLLPSTYETAEQRTKRFERLRTTQKAFAEKLCEVTPNLKSCIESAKTRRFQYDEPLMDCLSQKHAYLLARTMRQRAFLGTSTPISVLKMMIRRYIRRVYEDDCALLSFGIINLTRADIEEACTARCIDSDRNELEAWVKRSAADASLQATTRLLMHSAMSVRSP